MSGLRMGSGFAIRSGINFCKLSISLVAAFLISSFILPAPTVNAASESYTWAAGNGQQIRATGGVFGSNLATIEKASDGTWRIKSDTRLSLRSGPCTVGPRTGVFLRFDVDLSSSKLSIHNPPFDGDATAVAGCSQAAGSNSFDYGEKVSIKGTAPKPDQPTTTSDACSYFSDNKAQQACRNGAAAYARDGVTEANKVCDNGGSEMNTQTLKDACKEGVRTANLESLFGPVVNVVCSETDPAVHNTCVKKFNTTLISCMNGSKADLAATKTCMIGKYPAAKAEIEKISNTPTITESESESKSTCTIAGIGWIVCPVVNFLSGIADSAYTMVAAMLTVPAVDTTNTKSALYQAWSIVRNLANICFVIAFLVIIYSQITSAGISNYGIKKLLPKLIISAVLVNVSYWLCALAVDISNFLGYAISGMFATIGQPITGAKSTTATSGNSFTALAAVILIAGAATAFLHLSMLLPLLVGAVLVITVVVIILTLRQGLIVMLIVISPLAFVAYLLPNTSKLFDKWWSTFKALLLMFPIVAFVYAGSALAGKVLSGVAEDMDGTIKVGFQIMAVALPILSFVTVYTLMKTSSALLGKLMNNNPAKGIGDRMKRGAENRGKRWDNQRGTFNNRMANSGGRWGKVGGALIGGGASRRANSRAIDRAAERNLQRSEEDLVARRAAEGGRFAQQLSRGAGQEGLQRAISDAQFTIEEAEIKEARAARVTFERGGLEGMGAMRTLDSGVGSDGKALTSAQKIALRSMVVEAGHAPDVAKVWNSMSGEGVSNSERNAFASDLTKNKPTGVGMGAIAKMRAGGNDTFDETVADGLVAGRYDAAGAAKSDNSELEMVRGLANNPSAMKGAIKRKLVGEINATRPEGQKITEADVSDDEVQKRTQQVLDKLRTDAHTASTDPRFNAGKARTTLDVIVKDLGGPPQAASTTSTPPTSTSHQGQTFNQTEGGLYIPRS